MDVRERPLRLARWTRRARRARAAARCSFRSRSSMRSGPSRARRFSSPSASRSCPATEPARTAAEWTRTFTDALEIDAGRTRRALLPPRRRPSGARSTAASSGVNGIYDAWRWLRARLRGEKFTPEHQRGGRAMIAWIAAASCVLAAHSRRAFPAQSPALRAAAARRGSRPARLLGAHPRAQRGSEHRRRARARFCKATDVDLEVIVLDDGSTDRTAEIVREIRRRPIRACASRPRRRCPPAGAAKTSPAINSPRSRAIRSSFSWTPMCASRAPTRSRGSRHFIEQSGAALVSGVPREETRGLMEKLIIPLIHFVLLGFLPLDAHARRAPIRASPPLAAKSSPCAATPTSAPAATPRSPNRIHDAVALTRAFRAHGLATDLFDATDTFHCRMYRQRRARSGTASPRTRTKASARRDSSFPRRCSCSAARCSRSSCSPSRHRRSPLIGTVAALLPRLIAVVRFRQSLLGALLHPLGICAAGRDPVVRLLPLPPQAPAVWKGRSYSPLPAP